MTCEELKNLINDYFDNLLDDETKEEFEKKLEECKDIKNGLDFYTNFLFNVQKYCAICNVPTNLLANIEKKIIELKEQEQAAELIEKKLSEEKITKKTISTTAFADITLKPAVKFKPTKPLFLIVLVVAIFYLFNTTPSTAPWVIQSIKGTFGINGKLSTSVEINEGSNISTDHSSLVRLKVAKEGIIELEPLTEIKILEALQNRNIIILIQGRMKVFNTTDDPSFIVETQAAIIKDEGSDFIITQDTNKNLRVEVFDGFIKIKSVNKEINLSSNYVCGIILGKIPGIPYHKDATQILKEKLLSIYKSNGKYNLLVDLLNEIREDDALTLWYLLKIVNEADRKLIFTKLYDYFPTPEGVTRSGILNLNDEMFQLWWEEIEWQL
jgi:F0F1-type ATP synthase assembly protein I